jgi:hypothetical protein
MESRWRQFEKTIRDHTQWERNCNLTFKSPTLAGSVSADTNPQSDARKAVILFDSVSGHHYKCILGKQVPFPADIPDMLFSGWSGRQQDLSQMLLEIGLGFS